MRCSILGLVAVLTTATLAHAQAPAAPGIVGASGVVGEPPAGTGAPAGYVRAPDPKIPEATGTVPIPFDASKITSPEGKRAKRRDDLAHAVYRGEKRATDAVTELDDGDDTQKNSPEGRLAFGQEALEIGMRLSDAQKPAEAAAFFTEAEKALAKAAQGFGKKDPAGQAEALYALAHLRGNFLGKKLDAYRDLTAALAAAPKHAGALTAKAQLETQYPTIKTAKLPSDGN